MSAAMPQQDIHQNLVVLRPGRVSRVFHPAVSTDSDFGVFLQKRITYCALRIPTLKGEKAKRGKGEGNLEEEKENPFVYLFTVITVKRSQSNLRFKGKERDFACQNAL
jgi:hypothetical protein